MIHVIYNNAPSIPNNILLYLVLYVNKLIIDTQIYSLNINIMNINFHLLLITLLDVKNKPNIIIKIIIAKWINI